MELTALKGICANAFCGVCFETFDALAAAAHGLPGSKDFGAALEEAVNEKNLWDKGRKPIFCLGCPSVFHAGCFKPEGLAPVVVDLEGKGSVSVDCFQCPQCTMPEDDRRECALCGIAKGLLVPMVLATNDGSTDKMEIEEPFSQSRQSMCHVVCGLTNNGIYQAQRRFEIDPAHILPKLERKCFLCDCKVLSGPARCQECNLHVHSFCLLSNNAVKSIEESLSSGKFPRLDVHVTPRGPPRPPGTESGPTDFSPDHQMNLLVADFHHLISQSHFVSPKNLDKIFRLAIQKKLRHFNRAISESFAVEFRCRHHKRGDEEAVEAEEVCRNCRSHFPRASATDSDSHTCPKCRTLKKVTKFESKKDFFRLQKELAEVARTNISIYDRLFLGRVFFDRLVFILPADTDEFNHLVGFKLIKKRLVEELSTDFKIAALKTLKEIAATAILDDHPEDVAFQTALVKTDAFTAKFEELLTHLPESLVETGQKILEFLKDLSAAYAYFSAGGKTMSKVLAKLEALGTVKELAGSQVLKNLPGVGQVAERILSDLSQGLKNILTQDLDNPFRFFRFKTLALQIIAENKEPIDTHGKVAYLLLVFLANADLIDSFEGVLSALESGSATHAECLQSAVEDSHWIQKMKHLDELARFAKSAGADISDPERTFTLHHLQQMADFKNQACHILASLQKSNSKRLSKYNDYIQHKVIFTVESVGVFLDENRRFESTETFANLKSIHKRSKKMAEVFTQNLLWLINAFVNQPKEPSTHFALLRKLTGEYFTLVTTQNLFVEAFMINLDRKLSNWNYLIAFANGKLSRIDKVELLLAEKPFQVPQAISSHKDVADWKTLFVNPFEKNAMMMAEKRKQKVLNEFQGFQTKIFSVFSTAFGPDSGLVVNDVYEEVEKLKHFPLKGFEREIEFCEQLIVVIEAIKRAISPEASIKGWKLLDLIVFLINTERWTDSFRKHNRIDRFVSIVSFVLAVPDPRPEIMVFFKPILQVVLQRKLEGLAAQKLYVVDEIVDFLRLSAHCEDQMLRQQISDYKIFKFFVAFLANLRTLFYSPAYRLFLSFFVAPAEVESVQAVVSQLENLAAASLNISIKDANGSEPMETEAQGPLDSVRGFVRAVWDVLERARKFEVAEKLDIFFSFLESVHKKFVSLNLLIILGEGKSDVWQKLLEKYNTSIERLRDHIENVRILNEKAMLPEIDQLLATATGVNRLLKTVNSTIQKFKSKSAKEADSDREAVTLEFMKELQEQLRPHKEILRQKYDEVKQIIQFIENFEANLEIESDNLVAECLRTIEGSLQPDSDPTEAAETQRQNRQALEKLFLGVGEVEMARGKAYKGIRNKYYDTKELFLGKNFTSASIEQKMSHYKAVYELYRFVTAPKTPQELSEFLQKIDLSLFKEGSPDAKIIERLNQFARLVERVVVEGSAEIDMELLREVRPFRGLVSPGGLKGSSDSATKRFAALVGIKFLGIDLREGAVGTKPAHQKMAAHAILQSNIKLAPELQSFLFEHLEREAKLLHMFDKNRLTEKFWTQVLVEEYAGSSSASSKDLDGLTATYLTQVERVMNVRFRSFVIDAAIDQSLTVGQIAEAFECNLVSERKAAGLRQLCTRAAITKLAIVNQKKGLGWMHPLTLAIQRLIDTSEYTPDFDSLVENLTTEKNKVVCLNTDSLSFPKVIRNKPTDRGLFTLFGDLRLTDQVNPYLVYLTQLGLVLHIYFCIVERSIVLKIKELKIFFNEIRWLLQFAEQNGFEAEWTAKIGLALQYCWSKAEEIVADTERYVASLSSITIDVDTVFKFKSIVSANDMIEGIMEVNSKWVDTQNPWGKQTLVVEEDLDLEATTAFLNDLEEVVLAKAAEEARLVKEEFEADLEAFVPNLRASIQGEIGRFRDDLNAAVETTRADAKKKPKEAPSSLRDKGRQNEVAVQPKKMQNGSVESADQPDAEKGRQVNNLTSANKFHSPKAGSNHDLVEVSDSENEHVAIGGMLGGAGTLEGFLGIAKSWKRFQKAIRVNPQFDFKNNSNTAGGFAKKLEGNFRNLSFMFSATSEDDIERFLESYKDIDILVDRYTKGTLTYKDLVDLVQNPEKRLRTSAKKKKGNKKPKNNLFKEILNDLDQEREEERQTALLADSRYDQPDGQADTELGGKRAENPMDDDANFMEALETKRVKETAVQIHPVTYVWRLNSPLLSKILFFDDRVSATDKVVISNAQLFTTEPASLLFSFPDFKKPLKFRTSELKKHLTDLRKDFDLRKSHGDNIACGFVFLPAKKLQNAFYSEFEKGTVAGYACAPNMQMFLSHSSMLQPEFFQKMNLYLPPNNDRDFSDLFVFFLKRLGPEVSDGGHLSFEKDFESDDTSFDKVMARKMALNQSQVDYFNAVVKAKYFNVQPHIYFKMGPEILSLRDEMFTPLNLGRPAYRPPQGPGYYGAQHPQEFESGHPVGLPSFPQALPGVPGQPIKYGRPMYPPQPHQPAMPRQPVFQGYGYVPPGVPHQVPLPVPTSQPVAPARPQRPVIQFESADTTEPKPTEPVPAPLTSDALTAEEQEIKEMIEGQTISDLADIWADADDSLKQSILKVLRIERPADHTSLLALINQN